MDELQHEPLRNVRLDEQGPAGARASLQPSISQPAACEPSTAPATPPSRPAAPAQRRLSKDDSLVHDGRMALIAPSAYLRARDGSVSGDLAGQLASERLLSPEAALTCPWDSKRRTHRLSHHGDIAHPLLSPAEEAVLPPRPRAATVSALPPVAAPSPAGKAKGPGAGGAAMMMMMVDGESTCVITASVGGGGWVAHPTQLAVTHTTAC